MRNGDCSKNVAIIASVLPPGWAMAAAERGIAMASIYKRGKIWWVHYLVGGKSVSRSLRTTSERVALDKKKHLEALEVTGQLPKPSNTPVDDFLESFCSFLWRSRTRKSAKNDISYLRMFFGPRCPALRPGTTTNHRFRDVRVSVSKVSLPISEHALPVRRLEELSTEMVSQYIHRRIVEDGIAPKTANRIREVLHRMFSFAIEHHGYICPDQRYRNPVEGVRRVREPAPVIAWLNGDQIGEQLRVLESHATLRAIVATLIYAGLRREGVLWLTVDDVDLQQRLIQVRAKNIGGAFWQPKTKRNRVVPISSALHEILTVYTPARTEPWFFPSPRGKRWDPDNFSETLRKLNRQHGLGWSCLDFRHTFGSHLAQKGESLYKIAELMGNSPAICRKHYAALLPEKMHDVVEFGKDCSPKEDRSEAMLQQILDRLGESNHEGARPKLRLVKSNH